MQRKPAPTGALLGPTEGVTKAAKEEAGTAEAAAEAGAAAALGVVEGEGVPVPVCVALALALAPAAAALGVKEAEGVSVPLGVALAGALLGAALALTPGRVSVASQAPPHLTYCAGQAVLPLCWQHVSMGSATLRGLKCMR